MSFNDFFISAANVLVCRWPRVQRDQYWPRWPTETCSCIRPCLKAKRASAAPPRVTHSLLPGSYAHAYKCTHSQHMQKWSFVSVQTEHSSHSFIVPSYSHTNHNPFAQKVGLFEYDSPLTDPCYTNAATHCCQKPEHFRSWKVSKEICVKICIDSIHVNYVYRHFHQEESLSSDFGKSSCQGNLVHLHVLIKILIYGISECAIYHGVSIFCPTSLWLRVWKWYSVSRSGLTLVYPRDFLHYAPCFGLAFCIANPGIVELSAPAWTYFHSLH